MSKTVLIVDDNVHIRRSLRSCIERHGELSVCGEAENGAVAVERVKELRPDVIILDLQMPVMNGLEAAREIAMIAPEIPMVMLSLHANDELVHQAKSAGISEVISKTEAIPQRLLASLKKLCASRPASLPESV
ncbi:MAG: response regulator [Candidatus Sulfotelmatobacter sp.]